MTTPVMQRRFAPEIEPQPLRVRTATAVAAAYDEAGVCGDAIRVANSYDGAFAFALVDVAGHGAARAPLSRAVGDAVMAALVAGATPSAALAAGDARLRCCDDECPYAVAFAARLHPRSGSLVYAVAGLELAFVLDRGGRQWPLAPTAPMLGIPWPLHPCDGVRSFAQGGTLVVASDGVGDSRPAASVDFFGAERAAAVVEHAIVAGADAAHALVAAARSHAGNVLRDDAAALVVRVQEMETFGLKYAW